MGMQTAAVVDLEHDVALGGGINQRRQVLKKTELVFSHSAFRAH